MVRILTRAVAIGVGLSLTAFAASASALLQVKADNTKVNTRDRDSSQPTADSQKNNKSDVVITRDIRKALVADKSLSAYAHNIKIITQHGAVTLKGPVRNQDEKNTIEAKAAEIAGAGHVTSDISIAPPQTK